MLTGETVPAWGGVGAVSDGNYADLPGKGFAKVLKDPILYPADSGQQRHFVPAYPAPHWRPAIVESDNRIPANQADISSYRFQIPPGSNPITVTARLIFRRAYKNWLDAKGLKIPDMEIARKSVPVR